MFVDPSLEGKSQKTSHGFAALVYEFEKSILQLSLSFGIEKIGTFLN